MDQEEQPEPTGYRLARTGAAPKVLTVKSLAEQLDAIATHADLARRR